MREKTQRFFTFLFSYKNCRLMNCGHNVCIFALKTLLKPNQPFLNILIVWPTSLVRSTFLFVDSMFSLFCTFLNFFMVRLTSLVRSTYAGVSSSHRLILWPTYQTWPRDCLKTDTTLFTFPLCAWYRGL